MPRLGTQDGGAFGLSRRRASFCPTFNDDCHRPKPPKMHQPAIFFAV